jgi:hypothetical protein
MPLARKQEIAITVYAIMDQQNIVALSASLI